MANSEGALFGQKYWCRIFPSKMGLTGMEGQMGEIIKIIMVI
jgi:hypothetical protein